MDDFPGNRREPSAPTIPKPQNPEEKIIQPIAKGGVILRKKPLGRRVREMFVGDDTSSIFEHVFGDILVPAFKEMIYDAFTQGMERKIWGGDMRSVSRRTPSRPNGYGSSGHVNYSRYGNPARREDNRPVPSRRSRTTHDFYDIIIATRPEATEILDEMCDQLRQYEIVSVRTLYELCGEGFSHTDEKWGWTDLSGASVSRISGGGYRLNLPKVEPID